MIPMTLKLCLSSALLGAVLLQPALAAKYWVYTGTYTRGPAKGIYAFSFDPATGAMGPAELKAETSNPSWLTIHPNGKFLYAVNEENQEGMVTAFAMDTKTGALTKLNSVSSGGSGPCHLALDKTGKLLLTANYGSGSVGVTPIGADGRLGETVRVQHKGSAAPHAHEIVYSKDNRFAFVPELGLNQIISYRVDPAKGITANDPPFVQLPTGNGPRHFAFHPNGKFAYGNNETSMSATAFTYDATRGELKEIQTLSTLPADYNKSQRDSTSEAEVDSKGKFLYVANRGHNSIAVFAIGGDGKLTVVEHAPTLGRTPRNFKIDPTGNYLFAANQDTNNIVQFRIDPKTGKLTPTGKTIETGTPVCLVFVPVK
jgi:6-phosphogluconolactonase